MNLRDLVLRALPGYAAPENFAGIEVAGVETDSRAVEPGFIFIAIQGVHQDGSAFVKEALERKAVAIITERNPPQLSPVPFIQVQDARASAALLSQVYHQNPSASVKVIGITGTNGKTTSSYILEHLLTCEQKKAGVIGTVSCRFGGIEIQASETTPGPLKIQKILSAMRDAACDYAALEVSSHALDQKRVLGVDFCAALFTNLTQDHLDYHKTMEAYFEAKVLLFSSLSADKIAVINTDDDWGRKLPARTQARVISYGVRSQAMLMAASIHFDADLTEWDLILSGKKIKVSSPLVGLHNVYNVLGAFGVLYGLGFSLEKAAANLASFAGVPGRLERVVEGQNFKVYIDFAHTPDGLLNVLGSLQEYRKKKLLLVFGCGGDRDRGKRPKMAAVAAELADFIYITSDNPRSENPKIIADEICAGFPLDFKNYTVVLDRRKAIRQALMAAREGDVVLLAGKGHEKTQVVGGEVLPFSDLDETQKVLRGK